MTSNVTPEPSLPSTRERIAQAALDVLSATSIDTLTVRDIAAKAGVNVATVHYYFRTKEAVVAEVLRRFFAPVLAYLGDIVGADLPPREKLVRFLVEYTNHFFAHPGVFTSLMETMLAAGYHHTAAPQPTEYQVVLLQLIGTAKGKVVALVGEITGLEGPPLVMAALRLVTSVLHPFLISSLPLSVFGLDFRDETVRRTYLAEAVSSLPTFDGLPAIAQLRGHGFSSTV